jgi:G3E family GTPase
MRVAVVVLAGLHADLTREVAGRMLAARPARTVVMEHDITGLADGVVVRTMRDLTGSQQLVVELAHGCVGCTLRESVLPALAECARHDRYRTVVLVLPPAIEPEPVARELARGFIDRSPISRHAAVHAVVTAVDPARLPADVDGVDTLAHRGLACAPADRRFVAEVMIRQIEHADVVIGPYTPGVGVDLLSHLNPGAELVPLRSAGGLMQGPPRHDPRAALVRSEPGTAFAPLREHSGSVASVVWRARRPLHPARLHHGLRTLVPAVIRTRGHVWLANKPEMRCALATSGPRVELGSIGRWLDETPARQWAATGPAHRARAALDWDAGLGDRGNELVLTGVDLDRDGLHALLEGMTLTEEEHALGPARWRTLPNPFAPTGPRPAERLG